MEWVFLFITWLPVISLLAAIALLLTGFALRSTHRRPARICGLLGGISIAVCLLFCGTLFLSGLLGLGPVPN